MLPLLATAAGTVAGWIYGLFDARISINPDGRVVRIVVSGTPDIQGTSSGLRVDTVTYGLPMVAALVIATRSNSVRAKIRVLLICLGVMAALTVPVVMAWAKLTSLQLDEQIVPSGDRSSFLFYVFHGYAFSQPVIAVALWLGMMMLGMFKQIRQTAVPLSAVPRNAPCPCGSGRKYKKCCGK